MDNDSTTPHLCEYRYNYGTSKYNRLRSFIEQESNGTVAKVLIALAEHQETLTNTYTFKISSKEIIEIANKLNQNYEVTDHRKKKIEFEGIEKVILNELKKASFTIWIAVAWFTNSNLFDCLLEKKAQGVNIQIIINNDEINNKSGLDFSSFESYKLSSFGTYGTNIIGSTELVLQKTKNKWQD
jgi:phosphatidylserine/phosphatidylglycerophosphate/cardiolipin synthase-like enzyme